MHMRTLALVLIFATLAPACSTTHGSAAGGPAKTGEDGALAKKKRALEDAELELKIAEQECAGEERRAKDELDEAERHLQQATADRKAFLEVEKEIELARLQLGLDRTSWSVEADRQEMQELVAMYKKDDLAKMTKEMVIQRAQKKIDFGLRELENEQREASHKREHDLAKKLREQEDAVIKAEHALREARAKQALVGDANKLKRGKQGHVLQDLREEIRNNTPPS